MIDPSCLYYMRTADDVWLTRRGKIYLQGLGININDTRAVLRFLADAHKRNCVDNHSETEGTGSDGAGA